MVKTSIDHRGSGTTQQNSGALPDHLELGGGQVIDLRRSRWDGILGPEELERCRESGVPVGFDCAQGGWVPLTVHDADEVDARPGREADSPSDGQVPDTLVGEHRETLRAMAAQLLSDLEPAASSEDLRQRLDDKADALVRSFRDDFGVVEASLCRWALRVEIEEQLAVHEGRDGVPDREASDISFRSWAEADAERYYELLSNPNVWVHLPEPYPEQFTIETARTLIEVGAISFHHETVAIELAGEPVGQCLLRFDRPMGGARAAEVAYWLGESHWGQGVMTKALPAFVERSFQAHRVDVIYAWIKPDNEASVRAASRAGFRRDTFEWEGELAESSRRDGFVRFAVYRSWLTSESDEGSTTQTT